MIICQAHYFYFVLFIFIGHFCTGLCSNDIADNDVEEDRDLILNVSQNVLTTVESNASISCFAKPPAAQIWWTSQDLNITSDDEKYSIINYATEEDESLLSHSILHILNVDMLDTGNYTCNAVLSAAQSLQVVAATFLNVTIPGKVITKKDTVRLKIDGHDTLYCVFHGYPLSEFHWIKQNDSASLHELQPFTNITRLNETHVNLTLSVTGINRKNNGSYHCMAKDVRGNIISDSIVLLVLDTPQVQIDFVKAVGAHVVYMNWTVNDGNDPVTHYLVKFMKKGNEASWNFYQEQIGGGNNSYLLKNFEKSSEYKFRIAAVNNQGAGRYVETPHFVRTLDKDPDFVPITTVTGNTLSSITLGWTPPPPELKDHIHYFELVAQAHNSTTNFQAVQSAQVMNFYLFQNLEAATTYDFKVRACNEYTKQCGQYSKVVNGTTMDGPPGPPENVQLQCKFDNISQTSFVFVSFDPPKKPNGKIVEYTVVLSGVSEFKNGRGFKDRKTFGPKAKTVTATSRAARFDMIPANMNYTVEISGTTRPKRHGEKLSVNCTMPPTVPDKDSLLKFYWTKHEEHGKFVFKLAIPKISERSGVICCYRVFMVRLKPQQTLAELPSPDDMVISSYNQVHENGSGGAYVAEMFTSDAMLTVVFLGDGYTLNSSNTGCIHCTGIRPRKIVISPSTTFTPDTTNAIFSSPSPIPTHPSLSDDLLRSTLVTLLRDRQIKSENRIRRSATIDIIKIDEANADKADPTAAYDGPLDENSNYTAFVEIIVYGGEPGQTMAAYTHYMDLQRPAQDFIYYLSSNDTENSQYISLAVQILCGILLVAVIFIPAICLLHKYTKQVARAQGAEMITLRNSFRQLCRSLRGRHQLVSSHPPNMAPILKTDLFDAYVERHRDSDYGFQQEFEQLPDRFPDRTTRASDARENIYKNRYPDIKAYDQTRVRLSQVDSIAGSDYINANVVLGYKERKKFICAQGPMDNTVQDYWRMIWEQRLELIMMLTNLEEYSKTKCAKYWPDKTEGTKTFGDITVSHVNESRYSDYIIRELKVTRGTDERSVIQYHFLVWKDFMAPEHPHGILKFIKRMNEAHSMERGPILVHCSAGVGRTGTLVALDSLLQQLQEEQQVTIFNTICDLRHQRNFLVQSLKQYIFVYRALMEMALYGDTEIPANRLKTVIKNLKKCDKEKSGMLEEYEKLKAVLEDRKAFSVGTGDENRVKNRNELVIPYDRNRVILTPIPGHEHSTYINASFIEGYDNSESFIITQDPLESTMGDFWRMVFEQSVNIIVMLSDLGSDSAKKCPRYWPDDEITYDNIRVKYIQSESCPYYTKRELSVTNRKNDDVVMVTQLQYHGWPTVEGEVPEVTRGLIELADQVQALQGNSVLASSFGITHTPPIVIHCCYGSDRSSMFVGLCILIQQLRVEKRVDVFTTVRKLRSQRSCMINTFAQYEFLYRAILNYADLHHLCEDVSDT